MPDEDCLPMVPSVSDASSNDSADQLKPRRRRGKQYDQLRAGAFIGVKFSGCTRLECTRQSKKSGTSYQKCHCEIMQVNGTRLLVHHVADSAVDDQWMEMYDARIVIDRDEQWCAHGRLCNLVARGHTCKHGDKCIFCHNADCTTCAK